MTRRRARQPRDRAESAGGKAPATLRNRPYDAAGDLPGAQLNDPDETAASGFIEQRLPPLRRGRGPG